ncbi:MAG: hypothetical protein QM703_11550 [Gemmatales bacterium]
MNVSRWTLAVALLVLALPTSLMALTIPSRCLIVGKWSMWGKDKNYSFVHHLQFKSNGEMIGEDETIIDGKKTVHHVQGTWRIEGKTLTIISREQGRETIEAVDFKIYGKQLELSDKNDSVVFQRVNDAP